MLVYSWQHADPKMTEREASIRTTRGKKRGLGCDRCPDQDLNLPCQKSWHRVLDPGGPVNTWPATDKEEKSTNQWALSPDGGGDRKGGVSECWFGLGSIC